MPDGHGNTKAEHQNRNIPYNQGRDRSFGPANKYVTL
jgi:hypothetical protein